MTQVWQSALAAGLGGAALTAAGAAIVLARHLGASRLAREALARRVDDLNARLRAFESSPSPRPTIRVDRASTPRPIARPRSAPAPVRDDPASLISVPSLGAAGSEALAAEAGAALRRRYGSIWAEADSGESQASIARSTGLPIGQVELILGLRRPAPATSTAGGSGGDEG